jgi:predicted nicotinamide N-methyase
MVIILSLLYQWPGSILASREMELHKDEIKNKTVLVLGAGTGVEAQAAAMLGAAKVIATDINKLTLKLLKYGAEFAGLTDIIECQGTQALSYT